MTKAIYLFTALIFSMSINAQTMKIIKGDKIIATYTAEEADKVTFEEEDAISGQFKIKAYTESSSDSSSPSSMRKIALNGDDYSGYEVVWTEGDSIVVYPSNSNSGHAPVTFFLDEGAGTSSGTFASKGGADLSSFTRFQAYYGYDEGEWPVLQKYSEDGVITYAPMEATAENVLPGESPVLNFHNVGGLLRLNVKGTGILKKIILADTQESFPVKDNAVTLSLGDGVILDFYEATTFYIALPASPEEGYQGIYLEFVLESKEGEKSLLRQLNKRLHIKRSMITSASIANITGPQARWIKTAPFEGLGDISFNVGNTVYVYTGMSSPDLYCMSNGSLAMFSGTLAYSTPNQFIMSPTCVNADFIDDERGLILKGVSIPTEQKLVSGTIDYTSSVCLGMFKGKGTKNDPHLISNTSAIVKLNANVAFRKVVFRSNLNNTLSGKKICTATYDKKTDSWKLKQDMPHSGNEYDHVAASTTGEPMNTAYLSVAPCYLSNGYTVEFYDKADDEFPIFARKMDAPVTLNAGCVNDLGTITPVPNFMPEDEEIESYNHNPNFYDWNYWYW